MESLGASCSDSSPGGWKGIAGTAEIRIRLKILD